MTQIPIRTIGHESLTLLNRDLNTELFIQKRFCPMHPDKTKRKQTESDVSDYLYITEYSNIPAVTIGSNDYHCKGDHLQQHQDQSLTKHNLLPFATIASHPGNLDHYENLKQDYQYGVTKSSRVRNETMGVLHAPSHKW